MDNQKVREFLICIENESDARTNVLTQDLLDRLRRAHESVRVKRRKDDQDSQDLGSTLAIFIDLSATIAVAVVVTLLAEAIENFIKGILPIKNRPSITIKCPNGTTFPIEKKDLNFSVLEKLEHFLTLCLQEAKEKNILNSDNTLVILFGTNEWIGCSPEFKDSSIKSAKNMKIYFLAQFGVKKENLGDFFNSENSPDEIAEKMKGFIRDRISLNQFTDLLFYYVGPGEFLGEDYCFKCLPKENNPLSSVFPIQYLVGVTKEAKHLRHYFILDASFSGAACKVLSNTSSKETVLFCSSSDKEISKEIKQEPVTMFTGALLEVFKQGGEKFSSRLPVHELYSLAKDFIREKYKDEAIMPELHVFEQAEK
jgi:hypothetical protein